MYTIPKYFVFSYKPLIWEDCMGKRINIDLTWFGMETYFASFNYLILDFISEIFFFFS